LAIAKAEGMKQRERSKGFWIILALAVMIGFFGRRGRFDARGSSKRRR
jgi:hypothetical protein